MTCHEFQQQMLLRQSGELPAKDRAALDRHGRECPDCAAFAGDLDRLLASAAAGLARGDPSPAALGRIRAEAAVRLQSVHAKGVPLTLARFRASTLALAAALVLLLAGLFVLHRLTTPSASPGLRAALPPPALAAITDQMAAAAGTPPGDMDLAEIFVTAENTGVFQPLFQDECFTIEQASELVRQEAISRLDLDIMILEGLAI